MTIADRAARDLSMPATNETSQSATELAESLGPEQPFSARTTVAFAAPPLEPFGDGAPGCRCRRISRYIAFFAAFRSAFVICGFSTVRRIGSFGGGAGMVDVVTFSIRIS